MVQTPKTTQLVLEYDPRPPFHAGSPQGAGPELTRKALRLTESFSSSMTRACAQASQALKP